MSLKNIISFKLLYIAFNYNAIVILAKNFKKATRLSYPATTITNINIIYEIKNQHLIIDAISCIFQCF